MLNKPRSCDDSIGKLTITKREMIDDYQAGKEKWFPLVKVTKDSEVMGEVRLEYGISEVSGHVSQDNPNAFLVAVLHIYYVHFTLSHTP